jgi:hypothetical protein
MLQPDLGHPMHFVSSSTSLKIGICPSNPKVHVPGGLFDDSSYVAAARFWALHDTNFYKKNGITAAGVCSGLEKNGGHGCKRLMFLVPESEEMKGRMKNLRMVNFNQLWKVNLSI